MAQRSISDEDLQKARDAISFLGSLVPVPTSSGGTATASSTGASSSSSWRRASSANSSLPGRSTSDPDSVLSVRSRGKSSRSI